MDAAVEVAIAGQHRGRIEVALDDLALDRRIQRARHAVARGAGIGHDAEAQRFEVRQQAGLLQVERHRARAGRQRGLDPGLADQSQPPRVAREQPGGDDVARIAGVGAAGDGRDDHRPVGQSTGLVHPGRRDAALAQHRGRQAPMRVRRAGQRALDRADVEAQHAPVGHVVQRAAHAGPQARRLGIGLDQAHLVLGAAGQAQVGQRLLVDREQRGGRAVLGRHVGDRRAVAQRQPGDAVAEAFEVGADDLLATQELGQRQHQVGGGDAGPAPPGELDADDLRQAHPRSAAQHHALRLQSADADGDHAQRVDMRRVAVGADAGVGIGDAAARVALHLHHRRHPLQVDLMHDPVPRRDHLDIAERAPAPVDEVEAVLVAAVLDGAVLVEGAGIVAPALDGQRVVDDQLHRHHRIDLRRIAAARRDRVAQAGQVHQRGLPQDVVADDARGIPGEVALAQAVGQLQQAGVEQRRIAAAHQVLGMHARRVGHAGPGAGAQRLDGRAGIEPVEVGARQRSAPGGIDGRGGGDRGSGCEAH